ncbi:ComF family protein [Chitinophaga nivalis]|uniref:ComF family protein n=1 Tax=Chitinophaga nivalis TaxID=2991709 RepID=A0ABT3IVK4_9BACT|nr:ComF family protein [Chitinophaga nivalis]MCW3462283.1 ComF family protein [Chitinophaga nivalis]MCW3488026.1 ComF family protein [Chitinophaga nivalis]
MLSGLLSPLVHLFFPHCCEVCGNDLPAGHEILCFRCRQALPLTRFHLYAGNPVENIFTGRVPIQQATATYYYSQSSALQQLIHRFKYKQRKDIATYLGRQTGYLLQESPWMTTIDAIVPVPLFPAREKKRGYNQAALLADGIAQITGTPVYTRALLRQQYTDTQTRKGRTGRWANVATVFRAGNMPLQGKHLLLTDDVITTGATTEACSHALIAAGARVSICCLAFAYH